MQTSTTKEFRMMKETAAPQKKIAVAWSFLRQPVMCRSYLSLPFFALGLCVQVAFTSFQKRFSSGNTGVIDYPLKSIFFIALLHFLIPFNLQAQQFYFGADLSYVNEMEDCGASYNVDGIPTDPYHIFKDNGTNIVRLRLWHTPSWYEELNEGNRYSDYEDVRRSIMRAKSAGLQVLLDFHLSDNWADPSKQVAPAAWTSVLDDLSTLQDSLYNYIFSTLNKLAVEDLLPELVQIGNETNRGILLSQEENDAGWVLDWDRNAALFNTAMSAVGDIEALYQTEIKTAIHIADPSAVSWYVEQFVDYGVNFDIIGISYYWQWHDDTLEETGNFISSLKNKYPDKEVMIFETAYPWTIMNADGANNLLAEIYPGYSPFSPSLQKEWMIDLTQIVIDNGGSGVFYWEPGWVSTSCETQWAQGSSWDNATFFNSDHELIENGGIGWMSHVYQFPTSTDDQQILSPEIEIQKSGNEIWIKRSDDLMLNSTLEIGFYSMDGKKVIQEFIFPAWENNQVKYEMPALAFGFYVIMISDRRQFVGSKVMFQ